MPACRQDDGAARAKVRERSTRVALLEEMLGQLEKQRQRRQKLAGTCQSLRSLITPLQANAEGHYGDPQSGKDARRQRAVLIRYRRLCPSGVR
ncbi:MAG: hypothetical protein JRH20_10265 [Deltaproteobacteria bacterium]|nr:hypothetical protein [Deltaproteobacteria bacterium]